jgi:hypothetical protein
MQIVIRSVYVICFLFLLSTFVSSQSFNECKCLCSELVDIAKKVEVINLKYAGKLNSSDEYANWVKEMESNGFTESFLLKKNEEIAACMKKYSNLRENCSCNSDNQNNSESSDFESKNRNREDAFLQYLNAKSEAEKHYQKRSPASITPFSSSLPVSRIRTTNNASAVTKTNSNERVGFICKGMGYGVRYSAVLEEGTDANEWNIEFVFYNSSGRRLKLKSTVFIKLQDGQVISFEEGEVLETGYEKVKSASLNLSKLELFKVPLGTECPVYILDDVEEPSDSCCSDKTEMLSFDADYCGKVYTIPVKLIGKYIESSRTSIPRYKYYFEFTKNDNFKSITLEYKIVGFYMRVDEESIAPFQTEKIFSLESSYQEYIGQSESNVKIIKSKAEPRSLYKNDELVGNANYTFPDNYISIDVDTRYKEIGSDESKAKLALERKVEIQNISKDTLNILGGIEINYNHPELTSDDIRPIFFGVLLPGQTTDVSWNIWSFPINTDECIIPKPNYFNAVYYPITTTSEKGKVTFVKEGITYNYPYTLIFKSKYKVKESFNDACFGLNYDVYIIIPPLVSTKEKQEIHAIITYTDECGKEAISNIYITPSKKEQFLLETRTLPIRIKVK